MTISTRRPQFFTFVERKNLILKTQKKGTVTLDDATKRAVLADDGLKFTIHLEHQYYSFFIVEYHYFEVV